jgi:hypothetical protein
MKRMAPWLLSALVAGVAAGSADLPVKTGEALITLVICAPGYPGSTADAQPTMDRFASQVSALADWPAGHVQAIYYETEEAGLARMREADAVLAMVPLPFYVRHGADLKMRPLLSVEPESGSEEVWSLVARRGLIHEPADLAGWEVLGQPCYAPRLVRGPILGAWGEVPADVRFSFAPRVLSALRRAASEERIAVLLDRAQTKAMAALPFAADLEVVSRSKPLPATLICVLDEHAGPHDLNKLEAALRSLHEQEEGRAVLADARMKRFRPLDEKGMQRVRDLLAALPEVR